VGKRGGDRRHAALERGNPMNLRIGCGTQQAREPVSGGSRRGREKRRGRNERGTGRCRADAGESPREWTPAGMPMERRSLRNPKEGAWLCTSRAAVRCVSDSGYASTQRAVRTPVHIARSRGTTTRFVSVHARTRRGQSPGKPHDPEPCDAKSSLNRGTRLRLAGNARRHAGTGSRLIAPAREPSKGIS